MANQKRNQPRPTRHPRSTVEEGDGQDEDDQIGAKLLLCQFELRDSRRVPGEGRVVCKFEFDAVNNEPGVTSPKNNP